MAKPSKSEIRKAALRLLRREKKSKQDVFEILKLRFQDASRVADVLTYVPSNSRVLKYHWLEKILGGLLILISVLFILDYGFHFSLLYFAILIYGVLSKQVQYYFWISVLLGAGLFLAVSFSFLQGEIHFEQLNRIEVYKYLLPSLAAIGLSVWLERKLCPKPSKEKEKFESKEGKTMFRLKYRFEE